MFDKQDFQSASMFLGIVDEKLCVQSLRHIRANGLGKSGAQILGLPEDATIEQIVTRVEEYGQAQIANEPWTDTDVEESIAWLKQAAGKI